MKYANIDSLFKGICDAIREKDGTTELIRHQDIPERIAAISGGGSGERIRIGEFYTYNGGGIKVDDGVVSNFNSSSSIYTGKVFRPSDEQWEIQVKFKTPDAWVHAAPTLFASQRYRGSVQWDIEQLNGKWVMWLGLSTNNGSSWTQEAYSDYEIESNKWYWTRVIFNGEKYFAKISTDGSSFEEILSIEYSGQFYQPEGNNQFMFGGRQGSTPNIFDGSIDLKETYIKIGGQTWWGNG